MTFPPELADVIKEHCNAIIDASERQSAESLHRKSKIDAHGYFMAAMGARELAAALLHNDEYRDPTLWPRL